MKVRDIMTGEVKSLSPEMSVKDAMELLQNMQISGLPVIDNQKKLLGMFTEKEILQNILPSYIGKVGDFVYEENPKTVKTKISSFPVFAVKDVMRKDIVTVSEDITRCQAAHMILIRKSRR